MHRMILTGSLLLALSASAMAGQIYKWVDAEGNTHFGAQPPEGQQAAEVNPNITQPKIAAPKLDIPETDAKQEALDQEARQDAAKRQKEMDSYCERVRKDLAQMKANPRVRVKDGDETRRLTEEERQERMSKSEAAIKENCQ
ncbi:glycosyltransferase [Pseudomonas alcaligenes]|uniref:Glycosyltransferase n=1 Tax=Aquipseudomonas alcaligenes TaxID=43263 RepID=A0ABR7RXX7_AQUAC|nr:DUF4124 domain-containing protein [Pseudomonas alcaligenes]MBC9249569.1 glycosyltransferase [Pseudomonas alcaligenes]